MVTKLKIAHKTQPITLPKIPYRTSNLSGWRFKIKYCPNSARLTITAERAV